MAEQRTPDVAFADTDAVQNQLMLRRGEKEGSVALACNPQRTSAGCLTAECVGQNQLLCASMNGWR